MFKVFFKNIPVFIKEYNKPKTMTTITFEDSEIKGRAIDLKNWFPWSP